ncbi:hypothetical protein LguiA_020941 [Lonicera macranthoides]
MVLQKRLDYGFNGYQMPPTPRGPRSARRRRSFRKKIDNNQMCAFDLLATVAGKLLLEGEPSPSPVDRLTRKEQCVVVRDSVKKEQKGEEDPLKIKPCDKSVSEGSFSVSEPVSQAPIVNHTLKEFLDVHNDAASVISSDCSEKVDSTAKLVNGESRIGLGSFDSKVNVGLSGYGVSFRCMLEDKSKKKAITESPFTEKVSVSANVDMCSSEDPSALDNSVKVPCRDHSSCGFSPVCRDDVKLVSRDDDENSSWCTQPSTGNKAPRPSPCIADRRIRKILASKCWKVTQKVKEEEHFTADAETTPVYGNRKNCYNCQRSVRDYPFKKRKLYDRCSLSNSDGGLDVISSLPGQGSNGDGFATGTPAFALDQQASFQTRDSCVKLKIKSFRIPELFIEIPETATVGSLKRMVMDAVTAILSGGLRVGVLLQGKKIRDDNKTLLQTGISHDKILDALCFTLEPSQAPPSPCLQDRSFLLPCETPQPSKRYPTVPPRVHQVVQQGTCDTSPNRPIKNFSSLIESNHDSAPSPLDMSTDNKSITDSKALVAVPVMNMDAMAVVPVRKPKRSDVGQRRIRRPFSVSEVEALVQAVEKLGTGRWRDVKLRGFDNAKQRTYVDLKDKWKTLVHTARISPQQRRGEPVPQDLLDRVLTAHAYWSQHQPKQQLKHQS